MSLGGPSQTITASAPEYQLPYISDLYRMGQQIAYTPYTPYQLPRYAETSGLYQQGVEAAQQSAQTPGILGQVNVGGQNMGVMQAYMNPYQQAVTDVAKQGAMRDYQSGLNTLKAQAAQRGAFGGSRQAIAETEMMRNLGSQLSNIQMQGSAQAFDKAGQLYQQDMQNQMQKAQTLQQLGLADEARRQRDLDLMYQEFEKQRLYPQEQANAYKSIIFGQQMEPTKSTYAQPPNPFVQTLGLAGLLYGGLR
jgi:hypothetical protein